MCRDHRRLLQEIGASAWEQAEPLKLTWDFFQIYDSIFDRNLTQFMQHGLVL